MKVSFHHLCPFFNFYLSRQISVPLSFCLPIFFLLSLQCFLCAFPTKLLFLYPFLQHSVNCSYYRSIFQYEYMYVYLTHTYRNLNTLKYDQMTFHCVLGNIFNYILNSHFHLIRNLLMPTKIYLFISSSVLLLTLFFIILFTKIFRCLFLVSSILKLFQNTSLSNRIKLGLLYYCLSTAYNLKYLFLYTKPLFFNCSICNIYILLHN